MEATVQMQAAQMQAVQIPQGTYYRMVSGMDSAQTSAADGVQTGGFEALLMQMLAGTGEAQGDAALWDALGNEFSEETKISDAAMQMMAELLTAQPGLIQRMDPSLLAQLGGQSMDMVSMRQGGALPGDMLAILSQLSQPAGQTQPNAAQGQAFAQNLLQQANAQVIQAPQAAGAQDGAAFGQADFQRAVYLAQQQMTPGKTGEGTTETLEVLAAESGKQLRLQGVEAQAGAAAWQAQGAHMPQTMQVEVPQAQQAEDVQALLAQVKTGIMQAAQAKQDEFIIKLKPDGLGEITVRMVEHAGKITMELLASNQNTQRLLSSELMGLRQAMEPYHVVVSTGQAPNAQNGMEMQQQAWQQSFAQQQGRQQHPQNGYYAPEETVDTQDGFATAATQRALSGLDTYI